MGLPNRQRRLELLSDAGTRDEAAAPGRRDQLVVLDEDLSAPDDDLWSSGHLRAFEEVVVGLRVVRGGREGQLLLRIEDDEIRVRADRDRPLAGVEPEEL